MTPQQLIDLPHAGMAESKPRDAGMWRICITDTERLDWIAENTVSAKCDYDTWRFKLGEAGIAAEFIREDIDNAASAQYMEEEPTCD